MAAALPFVRTPLLPSAIAIGTMAPDVPYFVPLGVPRHLSHSLLGVVTVDLAITLTLVALWYLALRAPLVDLLPAGIRLRIPERASWRRDRSAPAAVMTLIVSAVVGILTHLAWDSFTHDGWLTDLWPALTTQLGAFPVYKWLQHASTIGGLMALAIWIAAWVRRTSVIPARRSVASTSSRVAAWLAAVGVFGGAGLITWVWGITRGVAPFDSGLVFLGATVAGGCAGFAGFVICAIWWVARRRTQTERSTATTLPRTSASSPRIGSNAELRGNSQV
jgi:hypothetical protein